MLFVASCTTDSSIASEESKVKSVVNVGSFELSKTGSNYVTAGTYGNFLNKVRGYNVTYVNSDGVLRNVMVPYASSRTEPLKDGEKPFIEVLDCEKLDCYGEITNIIHANNDQISSVKGLQYVRFKNLFSAIDQYEFI